jgi:hypothetical protein
MAADIDDLRIAGVDEDVGGGDRRLVLTALRREAGLEGEEEADRRLGDDDRQHEPLPTLDLLKDFEELHD